MALDLRNEQSVNRLRDVAVVLDAQVNHLLRILAEQSAEIDRLRGTDPRELQLRLSELEEAVPTTQAADEEKKAEAAGAHEPDQDDGTPRRRPQRGHGPTQQPLLERETRTYELDEPDQICPQCGGELEPWEGQCETSEMVDVVGVKYQLIEVKQQKYRCSCGGCVETAEGPQRAVSGGRYSLALAVMVCVAKYLDHLPLERQSRMMGRHGLEVTSQALWDQVWAVASLARPTYDALKKHILKQSVIGLDQTGWPNLNDRSATKWQMWCLTTPDAVYHAIRDDKSAATFKALVEKFKGTVVCDALSSHGSAVQELADVTLAGCWAHIRRKYGEAEPDFPEARIMLRLIRELYDIEERARSPAERLELRREESTDVLARMRAWMTTVRVPSTTSLGAAVRHTMKYWDRLTRFASNAEVWLDNNRTERGLRGPVVGRRNHFGSKSRRGTQAAAILYSLMETAKLHGLDPEKYLLELCSRAKLFDHKVLLPWDYKSEFGEGIEDA